MDSGCSIRKSIKTNVTSSGRSGSNGRSTKIQGRLEDGFPCVGDPGVGGKEVPGGEIQVPKRRRRSQFQLKSLHGGSEELAGDGGSSSMPHECLEVLDGLGGVEVMKIKTLNSQRSVNDCAGHAALDL